MTLPGETLATGAAATCSDCHVEVRLGVYKSAAGYYIGTWCDCGPYTRESGYYRFEVDAKAALANGTYYRP